MFRFTRAHILPIGVDLGSDSVKMLQLEVVNGGLSVVAAARQPMPDELRAAPPEARVAAAAGIVKGLLRQGGFAGRDVVLALPAESLHVKNLRLPPIPVAELPAAVAFEARHAFEFDLDAAHVQHLPAGDVRQGTESRQEVIVLAAKNDDVDAFVERFHSAGAIVQGIDVAPCALYRSVERFIRRREDEQDVHVLVDVGWRRTQVVIGRGRQISFVKTIELGARQLHEAVAKRLGISEAEAATLRRRLTETAAAADAASPRDPVRQAVHDATRAAIETLGRELALCLRYYSVTFRGSRPTRVRVVGGEACDASVLSLLDVALPLPAEVGRPLFSIDTSRMQPADRRGSMAEWAVALGLALKTTTSRFGARDGRPRDMNAPRPDVAPTDLPVTLPPAVLQSIPGAVPQVTPRGAAMLAAAEADGAMFSHAPATEVPHV